MQTHWWPMPAPCTNVTVPYLGGDLWSVQAGGGAGLSKVFGKGWSSSLTTASKFRL